MKPADEDDMEVEDDMDVDDDDDDEPKNEIKERHPFGYVRSPNGWGSCVRLVSPLDGQTVMEIELDMNEAAFRYSHPALLVSHVL